MADSHQTMREQPKKLYQSVGESQVHSGAATDVRRSATNSFPGMTDQR